MKSLRTYSYFRLKKIFQPAPSNFFITVVKKERHLDTLMIKKQKNFLRPAIESSNLGWFSL